jgi:hypothetical protein
MDNRTGKSLGLGKAPGKLLRKYLLTEQGRIE